LSRHFSFPISPNLGAGRPPRHACAQAAKLQ
jgi:hypothetical protein